MLTSKVKKYSNFAVEKPGRHYLNQVFKVDTTRNGKNRYHVPPDRTSWGHNTTSEIFFPKIHGPNLITRKHWTRQHWGAFYKYLVCTIRKCQGLARQRQTVTLFQTEEQRDVATKCEFDSRLDPGTETFFFFCYKGHLRKRIKSESICILDNSTVSVLISQFWSLYKSK